MRTNREEWQKRVARWQESGLAAEQYASELRLNTGTLRFWSHKLSRPEERARIRSSAPPERLRRDAPLLVVELRAAVATEAAQFELELGGGRLLRIPASFEVAALERLLAVL